MRHRPHLKPARRARSPQVRLGLRENAGQFSLLVALNAFVGAMVGLERSALPLAGREQFHLSSSLAVLSFIVAFGLSKAAVDLVAGALAERAGRRRVLILGWALGLPVPLLIWAAPGWWLVVLANLFLGANQGLAWSMTVNMKIDLVGPRQRGLALGLNEAAGYGGVAIAAAAAGGRGPRGGAGGRRPRRPGGAGPRPPGPRCPRAVPTPPPRASRSGRAG